MSSEPAVPSEVVIRAQGLGKFYPRNSARGMLRNLWLSPLRPEADDFWALRDVSFEVRRGEVLGLIGQNGCGKSTLMKMIAGLLAPSEGTVEVARPVAALLELGAGFDPEFTGHENVLLSGAIYGYTREDMEQRYDDIVAFADIGGYIQQPVKTYSSGMFARLAFSVAIHVNPRILLVDEILSVGDVGFQARCFQRIEKLRDEGATIVFVSHDMSAVQILCNKALLLERGRVVMQGKPLEVTDHYFHMLTETHGATGLKQKSLAYRGSKVLDCDTIVLEDEQGERVVHPQSGARYRVRCPMKFHEDIEKPVFSLQLKTVMGLVVYDHSTLVANQPVAPIRKGARLEVIFDFHLHVCPGPYRLAVGIAAVEDELARPIAGTDQLAFEVMAERVSYGVVNLDAGITIREGAS